MDLRLRVVAVIADGLSCRQAADRFGVSPSSAIRWRQLERERGSCAPRKLGGDRRSGRIEAEAGFILSQVAATPDITLSELAEKLRQERGLGVAIGTIWRFFERRGITFKKKRRMPPSRTALTL
jgi:transposase